MVLNKFKAEEDLAWGTIGGCMLDQVLSCIIMSKKCVIWLSSRHPGWLCTLCLTRSRMETTSYANKLEAHRRRNSWYDSQTYVPSFSESGCSSFLYVCGVWALWRKHFSVENRLRAVFKVSASTKTFQSPRSFSVHRDPLECHLLLSDGKAFLSSPLCLVELLSSQLSFLPLWAFLLPPPPAASFGLTPLVSVLRQIRGLRFRGELVQILLGQQVCSWWLCSLTAQCQWQLIDSSFVVKPKFEFEWV